MVALEFLRGSRCMGEEKEKKKWLPASNCRESCHMTRLFWFGVPIPVKHNPRRQRLMVRWTPRAVRTTWGVVHTLVHVVHTLGCFL